MRDPADPARIGEQLELLELLAELDVPEPEAHADPPIGLIGEFGGEIGLRATTAFRGEIRRDVDALDVRRANQREQP